MNGKTLAFLGLWINIYMNPLIRFLIEFWVDKGGPLYIANYALSLLIQLSKN